MLLRQTSYAGCPRLHLRGRRGGGRRPVGEHLLRQHPGEHRVHPALGVAHGHAAGGVAVVAAAHGQHPRAARPATTALRLQRHLQRDLDRHRPGVGQEDVLQPLGGDRDQPLGQPDGRGVGQSTEHHVRHPPGLVGQRGVELGHGVPVHRRPPRRHPVHDLPAAVRTRQPQPDAGGGLDHAHRRRVGHRGVGVPHVGAVVGQQRGHVGGVEGAHRGVSLRRGTPTD